MTADLLRHLPAEGEFCYPDWTVIGKEIRETVPAGGQRRMWQTVAHEWASRLRRQLGGQYRVAESERFLLLSDAPDRQPEEALQFFEEVLTAMAEDVPPLPDDEGRKCLVMMFSQADDYFRYIARYYPGEEFPTSGAACLEQDGYLHIVLQMQDESSYDAMFVHQMTSACLRHLPIPRWLGSALVMRMEEVLLGASTVSLNPERFALHKELWNEKSIQLFWSGESWFDPALSSLGYDVALILWHDIEIDQGAPPAVIKEFIASASRDDAGEAACQKLFRTGLGDLLRNFLGEGDWKPQPELWAKAEEAP